MVEKDQNKNEVKKKSTVSDKKLNKLKSDTKKNTTDKDNKKKENKKEESKKKNSTDNKSNKEKQQKIKEENIKDKKSEDKIVKEQEDKPNQKKEYQAKHLSKESKLKNNKEKRQEKREKLKKRRKIKKISLILIGSIVGIYLIGVIVFSMLCYPQTIVADTDLSFHNQSFMKSALQKNAVEYTLNVDGLGVDFKILGNQIDYDFDVEEVVKRINERKNPIAWPIEIFKVHDFMSDAVVNFNRESATSIASAAIAAHNQAAVAPQNANFICNTVEKTADIKEEIIGNTLLPDVALNEILGYIGSGRRHLTMDEKEQNLPSLYADNEKIPNALEQANKILKSSTTLMMSTTAADVIDFKYTSIWLELKEGYVAGLNDHALSQWSSNLVETFNTVGKTRTYVAPYGKTCTVSGGDNIGWAIDEGALVAMINKQVLLGVTATLDIPCSSTLGGYTGPGGRDWGNRYIDIDLSQQMARMYDDSGSLIWSSAIVSGKPGENTPTGIYTIKQKKSPTILIGVNDPATGQPSYRSEVQYWMGFVGDMVGLHDASWQSQFGGDWWVEHGSHGCVNLPTGAAGNLYGICVSGDIVVCHN